MKGPGGIPLRYVLPAIVLLPGLLVFPPRSAAQLFKSAKRYYQEGKEHEAEGTVQGKLQARKAYETALTLEPDNTEYLMAMGGLYEKMGQPHNARDVYDRVSELDPKNVEAHYLAADIYANDWYNDYIRVMNGVQLQPFCEHDNEKALAHFQAAFSLDEDNEEAMRLFLSFALKSWRFSEMVEVGRELIRLKPEDPTGYLYAGIGLLRTWRYDEADRSFQEALTRMPPEDERAYRSTSYVLDQREGRNYSKMDYDGRHDFETAYWTLRDPRYLTDGNERLLEHMARTACADILYGRPAEDKKGWETDKGEVYIRYGEPENRVKGVVNQTSFGGGGARMTYIETWTYPDFMIHFEDYFQSGKFRLHQQSEMEMYAIVHDRPTYDEVDFLEPRFDIPYSVSAFKDRVPGRTLLEVSLGVPLMGFFVIDSKAAARDGVFLLDRNGQRAGESVGVVEMKLSPDYRPGPELRMADQKLVAVPPGSYLLAVEANDAQGDAFGAERLELEVPDLGGEELKLSDLSLAKGVNVTTGSAPNRRDLKADPNPSLEFRRTDELALYFGVYNLTIGPDGRSRYRVSTTVAGIAAKNTRNAPLIGFFKELIGLVNKEALSSTSDYRGIGPDEIRIVTFDLNNLPPDVYRLEVEARDLLSGRTSRKERMFRIKE